MEITYKVTLNDEDIKQAVEAHVKRELSIAGDVVITITNGGRSLASLQAVVDVVSLGSVEAVTEKQHPVIAAVIVDEPVKEEAAPFTPDPISEVEAVMQEDVTVAGVLNFD